MAFDAKRFFRAVSDLYEGAGTALQELYIRWRVYQERGLLPNADRLFERILGPPQDRGGELRQAREEAMGLAQRYTQPEGVPIGADREVLDEVRRTTVAARVQRACDLYSKCFIHLLSLAEEASCIRHAMAVRTRGLGWEDPGLGPIGPAREQIGNILVADALEALMADYVEACNLGVEWRGLVVHGLVSRDRWHMQGIVTFPLHAVENWDYWPLLAHEAGHAVQETPEMTQLRQRLRPIVAGSRAHRVYAVPAEITGRIVPRHREERRLAGEILADLYGAVVAGPPFLEAHLKYRLPAAADVYFIGNAADPRTTDDTLDTDIYVVPAIGALHAWIAVEVMDRLRLVANDTLAGAREYVNDVAQRSVDIAVQAVQTWHAEVGNDVKPAGSETLGRWASVLTSLLLHDSYEAADDEVGFDGLREALGEWLKACRTLARQAVEECVDDVLAYTYLPHDQEGLQEYWAAHYQYADGLQGDVDLATLDEVDLSPKQLVSFFSDLDLRLARVRADGQPRQVNPLAVLLLMATHERIASRYL